MIFQNIKTYASVTIDVGMVNSGREIGLWWFEGVICGEMDGKEEDTARVWTFTGSHDRRLPVLNLEFMSGSLI